MTPPTPQLPSIPRGLLALMLVGAALAVTAFLYTALARIDYPYELEFMTGACLDHVDRILDGEPIYVEPTAGFVTWLYGPLYFYTCAATSYLVGESSLVVLRSVSLAAALVSTVLAFGIVWRRSGSALAGTIAAGLWCSTYGIVGTWWDIGRVDSLFVAWTAVSLALSVFGGSRRSTAIAGGLAMTFAYLTKQSALVFAPAFACALAFTSLSRAALFIGVFAATLVPTHFVLDAMHDGWFAYYTWDVPRAHGYELATWWEYFPGDTLRMAPMILASCWYLLHLARTGRGRRALETAAWCSGLWLTTNLSRAHIGGAENVLIPTHLGFAIVAGLAVGEARHARPWRIVIPCLVLLQFACSFYRPWHYLPTAADRAIGDHLMEVLQASERPVVVPSHGHYARRAGHPRTAHVLAVMDVMRGPDPAAGQELCDAFLALSWDLDCDIVVLDEPTDDEFSPLLVRDPTKLEWDFEELFPLDLDEEGQPRLQSNGRPLFMPVVGLQARPRQIYRRKR